MLRGGGLILQMDYTLPSVVISKGSADVRTCEGQPITTLVTHEMAGKIHLSKTGSLDPRWTNEKGSHLSRFS